MTRESHIEKKVSGFAERQGWLCFKWSSPNTRAVPDHIYLKGGDWRMIEFKAPGEQPSKLQIRMHKKLEAEGFKVHVIDNIENGKALFAG